MRLIDADALPIFELDKTKANPSYYHLMEQIKNAPTVEQVKPWQTFELVREILDKLGRVKGRCDGVECHSCPFKTAESTCLVNSYNLMDRPQRLHEIAVTWLADHPPKPEPTEQERRKLQAWASLEFPWFAVDKSGNCFMYKSKPHRTAGLWLSGEGCSNAHGLTEQKFMTWDDEPLYTPPTEDEA